MKKNFKLTLTAIGITLIFNQVSFAQSVAPPKVTPPSPTASAFSKYGEVPVSYYTGIPNIEVPLFEISARDIKIPISLSYHAGGIKVADESSRVGLGWVLNAGGVISRSIINRDDLQQVPDAYAANNNLAPAIPSNPPLNRVQGPAFFRNPEWINLGPVVYQYQGGQFDLSQYVYPTGLDPLFRATDFEPDQFTFNFPGHAGQFVLSKTRQVILEQQQKIRIEFVQDSSLWRVTTADGYVYKFKDYEFIYESTTPGYQQQTAWYLSEIISPLHEKVKFHYSTVQNQYVKPVGSFYERTAPFIFSCIDFTCRNQSPYRHTIPGNNYSNIALDSIVWSHGKIVINMVNDRLDIINDKRISTVQLFDKTNQLLQQVVFNQDYFTSTSAGYNTITEFPTSHPSQALKRLKLNGVIKSSTQNGVTAQEKYSFSYVETSPFPPKNSFARDHWGYYNGKLGNSSLIPTFKSLISATPTLKTVQGVMGSERNPSADHMGLLSLKSITYPTGGKTTFFFEPNDFEMEESPAGEAEENEAYEVTNSFVYNTGNKGVVQSILFDLRDEFVDLEGNTSPVILRAAFRTNMSVPCNQIGYANVYFSLENEAGTSWGTITPNGTRCADPNDPECQQKKAMDCVSCCAGSMVFEIEKQFILPPGRYYWKAYMSSNETQIVDISAMFTWLADANKRPIGGGPSSKTRLAGGLRVRQIDTYEPERNITTKRKFVYNYLHDSDSNGVGELHSYGKRMVAPSYSYFDISMETYTIQNLKRTCSSCLISVKDSGHPQASYSGYPVGYSKVVEYDGLNGENGKVIYEYANERNEIINYYYPYPLDPIGSILVGNVPIRPPSINSIRNSTNGKLLRQTTFSQSGQKLTKTENQYLTKYNTIHYALHNREIPVDNAMNYFGKPFIILLAYNSVNSGFSYLSESVETTYNQQDSAKVTTNYYYDNQEHLQLTQQTAIGSNGRMIKTLFKYPADYTLSQSNSSIQLMQNSEFMHASPIEVTQYQNLNGVDKVMNRELAVYENVNGRILLKEKAFSQLKEPADLANVPNYIPSAGYDPVFYNKRFQLNYYSDGNISSVGKENDVPVSLIWGYKGGFPIAEVANAMPSEVFHTSFEETGVSPVGENVFAKSGLKVLNTNSFSFPLSYTPNENNTLISYWYYQNNQWNFSGVVPFQRTISTGASYLDEIRAFPKGSQMTTYAFHPVYGVISKVDQNNTAVYYEYDGMGRLKQMRDHNYNLIQTIKYSLKE